MTLRRLALTIISLVLLNSAHAFAQAPMTVVKPSIVTGEVTDLGANKIALNTKDGAVVVILSDKTSYKRVTPENPSFQAAVSSALSDIGQSDKLVVTGILSSDKKSLLAKSVYLMTKADIAQRNAKETSDWKARGITGRVVSVDPVAKTIGIEMRTLMGSSTLTLTPKDTARFLRYAPDSVKFSEARPSSILEVQRGDMLRALGDKGVDGTSFTAEEIVTGAFQTVAGTVKSVDTGKNEILITNRQTNKDMTIAVGPSTILKRFPEEMATRLAAFQSGQGGVRPPGQGGSPQQGKPENGQGQAMVQGRGGFGGARSGGIDDMLERFPNITPADLKVGDVIAVSSTKNGSVDHITAIKLLAGVEPFLRAAQASGKQTGQNGLGDFNIPGLEGFGNP